MNKNRISQERLEKLEQIAIEVASQQKHTYSRENRLLSLCLEQPEEQPRIYADEYIKRYGVWKDNVCFTGDEVIKVLKMCRLGHVKERINLMKKAGCTADQVLLALKDQPYNRNMIQKTELSTHVQYKRLILLAILLRDEQIGTNSKIVNKVLYLNRVFAGECLDRILMLLTLPEEGQSTPEQEVQRLKTLLAQKTEVLHQLQESFDQQLEESKLDEQAELIALLNANQYGNILDLLVSAKSGFERMREAGETVPLEIRSMRTLVRRLQEFVEDMGVTPILELGQIVTLNALEAMKYQYDGTPFASDDQYKQGKVVSPGWEIRAQGIVISYPKIREI